ncbi:MAG: ABC transporter substrate-binding protein [Deltaproteobacteria bacterium CG_4_8_14_3_um_filter_43_13]|nr:MAG: ABC transporter substrate-binding protein [Deltaproteobacteria bacterium CG2_30_43_15]PIX24344.1 MAG: ABC transporter substrate-binding protein [Deltaproteobacteria bacterium CG_4_8_14_3_um_filter_43_13]PIZ20281.1 MAG: ABC transporter substrate-binding protein [Deltaproteobacteria bacterium CG_4_10_14_0_8_um_filter_43_12]HCX90822.1 ABC transporter substrate-binding protein [Deltaproteobacteria bacterium]
MFTKSFKNSLIVLTLLISLTLFFGRSIASEVGMSEDTIKIGQWSPQTGPAALWGAVARGTETYFKMLNAEGGIHGRKLKHHIRDDAYQPPRTVAAVKELVGRVEVFGFAGGVGTATGMAVKRYLNDQKIPWVGPASGSSRWANPPTRYLFALYPNYVDEATILTTYAYETLKKKKVAFFYQNDDYGKEGLMGAKKTLEGYNTKLVQEVSVEPLDTDISSQVLRLKMANPDIVILWLLPKHAAMTMGAAAKIGFKPIWMTTSTLSDAPMMYDITEGLWEGVIFDCFAELPDSKDPLMIKYKKAHDEFAPKERWGMFFYAGFLFAEPMIEGFKRAGRDLTREKFVDAMETIKNWNGGIGHNITFAPNQRQGQRSVFLGKCVKGKAVKISDWLEVK